MKPSILVLAIGLIIGALNLNRGFSRSPNLSFGSTPADWPTHFEGDPLIPLPLTEQETVFSASFPGAIGVFQAGQGRRVILRRVNRATRRLHDSATCLKASGYELTPSSTEANGWTHFNAYKDDHSLSVRARIQSVNGGLTWSEASAWFWHATFHPGSGPWLAVTVLDTR